MRLSYRKVVDPATMAIVPHHDGSNQLVVVFESQDNRRRPIDCPPEIRSRVIPWPSQSRLGPKGNN